MRWLRIVFCLLAPISLTTFISLTILPQDGVLAQSPSAARGLGNLERVVVFAVQREIESGNLKNRSDLCIGFGNGLGIDEKAVISELRRTGMRVHPNEWCTHSLRGLTIAIVAPIHETSPQTYALVLELGDLSPIRTGEHFATLMKRGTYVVRYAQGSEPQLISYRQTCCSKTS